MSEKIKETNNQKDLEEKEGCNFYEISFLFAPELNEVELGGEISKLEKTIESLGGKIIEENWPKLIQLAYPIEKKTSAYFGYFLFDAPSECPKLLPEKLKFEQNLLRYLVIKRNKKYWQESQKKQTFDKKAFAKPEVKEKEESTQKEEKVELDQAKLEEKLEEILK